VVIGELKLTFNLELILQQWSARPATSMARRQIVCLAQRAAKDARSRTSAALGFACSPSPIPANVEVIVQPATNGPRRIRRALALVSEHQRRKGDPRWAAARVAPIMTAIASRRGVRRRCASGRPRRVKDLRAGSGPRQILLHNVLAGRRRDAASTC